MRRNEECKQCWTRGDFEGEWLPSDGDLDDMFEPYRETAINVANRTTAYRTTAYLVRYIANGSMIPFMSTFEAYKYCLPLRDRAVFKMKNLPWNVNLLNAFHNLHFTLFMADMNPVFTVSGWNDDRPADTAITVPAWQLWILQLVYKAATECLRDDYVKLSEDDEKASDLRISTLFSDDDHRSVGLELHVAGEGLLDLWVTGEPTVKKNGTLGFKHSVSLFAYNWGGEKLSIYGGPGSTQYTGPLKENMKNMKSYIAKELSMFTKELAGAEFNRPEYALCKINGGNL